MNIKQILQNVIDTYEVAKPLYGNDAPLYGNNTPLYPPYEDLYKLFSYIQDVKPELLTFLENILKQTNDAISILDWLGELDSIKESLPEEYKGSFELLIKMLQAICFYRNF